MTIATLREDLIKVACAAGLPNVRWKGEPIKAKCYPVATVSIRNFEGHGEDAIVHKYNATTDKMETRVAGARTFTASFEIDTNNVAGAKASWALAEEFRSGLYKPSCQQKMVDFCIALLSVGTVATVEPEDRTRFYSRSVIEATFYIANIVEDCEQEFIETISVEMDLEKSDGTPSIDKTFEVTE